MSVQPSLLAVEAPPVPRVAYQSDRCTLYVGDCLDVLATLPDASVDAVVTDPPYGLAELSADTVLRALTAWIGGDRSHVPTGRGFMGRDWDAFVPPPAVWDECLRVLKPGGHLAVFAGARTVDLMGLSIRLAGFEIRDSLHWIYGSGFPKSLDVSKAIDKQRTEDLQPAADVAKWLVDRLKERGLTRRDVTEHFGAANIAQQWTTHWTDGAVKPRVPSCEQWQELRRWLDLPDDMDAEVWRLNGRKGTPGEAWGQRKVVGQGYRVDKGNSDVPIARVSVGSYDLTDPATEDAVRWQGWGTALKPAHEPIVLARKPLVGTVAANVLEHGTGAINVDGCRVGSAKRVNPPAGNKPGGASLAMSVKGMPADAEATFAEGRWPANVLLCHGPECVDGGDCQPGCPVAEMDRQTQGKRASKPSKSGSAGTQRDAIYGGGKGMPRDYVPISRDDEGGASRFFPVFRYQAKAPKSERPRLADGTAHNTVKPLELMRWLTRLITPPGGTILEPFAGSGTTLEAAAIEGYRAIGIEREQPYADLCVQRLSKPIADRIDTG